MLRRLVVLGFLALFAMPTPASTQSTSTFELGSPPVATVTIPRNWNPNETDNGVEANSPDNRIYYSFEVARLTRTGGRTGEALGEAMMEAVQWVIDQGATLGDPAPMNEFTHNGMPGIGTRFTGKDGDGNDTVVDVAAMIVNETTGLIAMSWYAPGSETRHMPVITRMFESLRPVR